MSPGVSSCHYREVPPCISFSGSGFMATYQLGVAQCFLIHAPWILRMAPCVLGASAGSLVAAAVVCEMSPVGIRDEMLHFVKQMKAFTLGPLNPSINIFNWLEVVLQKYLPSDAHQLANGRLAVAMTRLIDSKLIIKSDFQSKEDVIQALLCSCFVPGYCGMLPPSIKGVHYVDGGFSSMQPLLPVPCSSILTVSPFSGEMDICPADTPCMWDMVVSGTTLKGNMANSLRILNALYPMALETLEQAYDSGYKDTVQFLVSNDIIPYMMMHSVSDDCDQSKTRMRVETDFNKEKQMKAEKEAATLTTLTACRSSAEQVSTGNQQTEEPLPHFEVVKNVLLDTGLTYLGMFGLSVKLLSLLLLPLTLSFYTALQCRHRVELLFSQVPELMFWAWHAMRHFTFFFYSIFICSLKKNINDRIMPFMMLLEWMNIQEQCEAPKGQRNVTAVHQTPSSDRSKNVRHRSQYRQFVTASQDYKKPELHCM
ncbi:patatin-like phospholipase domain-containing protein 2 [Sparus aurata]|uniref:patatin-like phospholipase domain-containing protein 2 n=1 Tax=Sparus aurata TaxID=8175 RepID=UPI0011C16580|nr:patatin-like phospholipase domain-containing protein 2 [Sparus aurata]